MNKLSSVMIGGALVLATSWGVQAAPLAPQSQNVLSAVEKVHGYHRSCRGEWSHRHTRDGDRVPCGRSYYYRDSGPSIHLRFGNRDRGHRHRRHHRGRDRH
jgi:hypothetical protein